MYEVLIAPFSQGVDLEVPNPHWAFSIFLHYRLLDHLSDHGSPRPSGPVPIQQQRLLDSYTAHFLFYFEFWSLKTGSLLVAQTLSSDPQWGSDRCAPHQVSFILLDKN